MNRRSLLATVPLAILAACSSGTTTTTPADIVQEAQTAANGLVGMLQALAAAYPTLIPAANLATIESDASTAAAAANTLLANLPATTSAPTVKSVEGYINGILNTLAGPPINGLIPAPFNLAVSAAAFIAPLLEAWVASVIPAAAASTQTAATRAKLLAAAPIVSTAQAMQILGGYVKK